MGEYANEGCDHGKEVALLASSGKAVGWGRGGGKEEPNAASPATRYANEPNMQMSRTRIDKYSNAGHAGTTHLRRRLFPARPALPVPFPPISPPLRKKKMEY